MGTLRGAAAGFAATVPMTIAMEGLRAALPREQFRRMPPREVVDSTVEQAGVDHEVDRYDRILLTTLAHFAFGTGAGAVYGAINGSGRKRWDGYTAAMIGIAYGLGVWAVAYGVVLPSLGLHRAATDDTKDRNEVLIASHVVWGAVLGKLAQSR
jgi:hypothetical protein